MCFAFKILIFFAEFSIFNKVFKVLSLFLKTFFTAHNFLLRKVWSKNSVWSSKTPYNYKNSMQTTYKTPILGLCKSDNTEKPKSLFKKKNCFHFLKIIKKIFAGMSRGVLESKKSIFIQSGSWKKKTACRYPNRNKNANTAQRVI